MQALAVVEHSVCAHPARAGGGVHGRDVRAGHRPGGGGVGHPGPGRDQHAAGRRRRHHQQHTRWSRSPRRSARTASTKSRTSTSTWCRCSRRSPAGPPASRPRAPYPEMFRKAFKLAETERPAAVYLAVPEHIDADEADYDLSPLPRNVVRADAPAARQVARAVDILRKAKRPVVLAGHGAARADATDGPGAVLREIRHPGGQHLSRQGRHARRPPQQHRDAGVHAARLRQLRVRQCRRRHRGRI